MEFKLFAPVADDSTDYLMRVIINQFKGVTLNKATGVWTSPTDVVITEAVDVFSVVADSTLYGKLESIAISYGLVYRQEEVLLMNGTNATFLKMQQESPLMVELQGESFEVDLADWKEGSFPSSSNYTISPDDFEDAFNSMVRLEAKVRGYVL